MQETFLLDLEVLILLYHLHHNQPEIPYQSLAKPILAFHYFLKQFKPFFLAATLQLNSPFLVQVVIGAQILLIFYELPVEISQPMETTYLKGTFRNWPFQCCLHFF